MLQSKGHNLVLSIGNWSWIWCVLWASPKCICTVLTCRNECPNLTKLFTEVWFMAQAQRSHEIQLVRVEYFEATVRLTWAHCRPGDTSPGRTGECLQLSRAVTGQRSRPHDTHHHYQRAMRMPQGNYKTKWNCTLKNKQTNKQRAGFYNNYYCKIYNITTLRFYVIHNHHFVNRVGSLCRSLG